MITTNNDQEYYDNEEKWGEARFVTLKNIIDNISLLSEDDSYFKNTSKYVLETYGKLAIKEFNVDILSKNKAVSFTVPPNLTFPFLRFMTDWYRVSVINECGTLTVLNINNNPTIHDYLQDNEAELLYDCDGNILEANSFNAEIGHCRLEVECEDRQTPCSDSYKYEDSFVKENLEGSYFEFSADLEDKEVVIEFVTAGLEESKACDIRVHHNMERAVEFYIKYYALQGQRNIPMNTVEFHRREKKKYFKRAERLLGQRITTNEIVEIVSTRYSGIS
tara:strand:+ start:613 stop:1443 length:831 start_codon:yes stop_codon:yes gene_type:complete